MSNDGSATVRAYVSPSCVFLAFDWAAGELHADFLGFAVARAPGFGKGVRSSYLTNKLNFTPITSKSTPLGSNLAPIQKFNWWDGGISPADRGKQFVYTITPVLGSSATALALQTQAAATIAVTVPQPASGSIATYFNRAVVSSQSFAVLSKTASLDKQMDWLANGLQDAVPTILKESDSVECAIYHLNDRRWILPAFQSFSGRASIVYFDKKADHTSAKGIAVLSGKRNISEHSRTKIRGLMHDKFIVSNQGGRDTAVLMGSTNFTPEAQTIQANLLHIIRSPQLANLYAERAALLAGDPSTAETSQGAAWHPITDVPGTALRVFFPPEPKKDRQFLDTVTRAVQNAKSSVLFCMFTATDQPLLDAIFAVGDRTDGIIFGLLNSIDDPDQPTKSGKPRKSSPISVEIYNRSCRDKLTLAYDRFRPGSAPAGFLPELASIDTRKYSGGKGPPIAIHIHHKFIVIDGDTAHPTIYTGSPNFSANSENSNDENVLEITGNTQVAQVYVAEFLRLYNHYRARALWNRAHPPTKSKAKPKVQTTASRGSKAPSLTLATSRDAWVKGAYKAGTKEYLARVKKL